MISAMYVEIGIRGRDGREMEEREKVRREERKGERTSFLLLSVLKL